MKAIHPIAALALSTLLLAGCGKEVVVGGQRDVETVATGDATPEPSPSRTDGARFVRGPGEPRFTSARGQGFAVFTADVRLFTAAGASAIPGGGSPTAVQLDGRDTVRVARGQVPAAPYTRARVVFRNVAAQVTGGLTVGGIAITGTVVVDIPSGDSLVVESALPFSPDQDAPETLIVDLDASTWLAATDPVTRRVPPTVFRNAVKLRLKGR